MKISRSKFNFHLSARLMEDFKIFRSGEILATPLDSIAMEPRALGVSSTLAPWSIALSGHLKKIIGLGGQGGLAPLGCLPLWGTVGVTLANPLSVLKEVFLQSKIFMTKYDIKAIPKNLKIQTRSYGISHFNPEF